MHRKGARLSNLRKTIDNHKKFRGKVNDCSDTDFVRTEQKTPTHPNFNEEVSPMRHTFLQVLTLFSVLCCLSSVVWSQTAPAVHGQGTPNVLPKFTGANSIGNTAIFERDGCISETANFVTTVAGILCLHDLGGGATVHVATNLTDRVAFIAENDVETGNPVGSEGFIASRDGGVGVLGVSANSLGNGFGVFGDSESPQGIGVLGRNNATSGDAVGVCSVTPDRIQRIDFERMICSRVWFRAGKS